MADEKVVVTGQKADEDIKTSFTYRDLDGSRQPVTYMGVTFAPDQTVDLAEVLPREQAVAAAKKLSANRYFDGGSGQTSEELQKIEQARAQQNQKALQTAEELQQSDARARARATAGLPDEDGPRLETQASGRPAGARR